MQHPRGVSIILGIGVALGVFVLLVVGAMVYGSRTQEKSTTTANANVGISDVVKLDCTQTSDCAAYCGLESTYTPYCDSTKHCTCSYSGEPVPSGNANIAVTDFVSCATAGNPVQESYPRKCSVGGVTFTEVLTNSNVNAAKNTNQSTNTNVSTAGWKTYTNTAWGFSFKYPIDWDITQDKVQAVGKEAFPENALLVGKGARPALKLYIDPMGWGGSNAYYSFTVQKKNKTFTILEQGTTGAQAGEFGLDEYYNVRVKEADGAVNPRLDIVIFSDVKGTQSEEFNVFVKTLLSTFTFTE